MRNVHESVPGGKIFRRGRQFPLTYRSAGIFLAVGEALTVIATSVGAGAVYHVVTTGTLGNIRYHVGVGLLLAVLYFAALNSRQLYEPARIANNSMEGSKLLTLWSASFGLTAVLAFTFKVGDQFSRGAALACFFLGAFTTVGCRKLFLSWLHDLIATGALTGPRVVVLVDGPQLSKTLLANLRSYGFRVARTFNVDASGYEHAVERLVAHVRGRKVDEILLVVNCSSRHAVWDMLERMRVLPMPVRLLADDHLKPLLERRPEHIGSSIALELRRAPLSQLEQAAKRCFDITVASCALLILAPAMLVIAGLIRFETFGPVLFRQRRVGFNGRSFSIFKFRSMTALDDGQIVKQAVVNDCRVTRIGKWLRRTSIDELPQLLNVLHGDMSLIGPRPHAEAHDTQFDVMVCDYALRQHVKPGMTGWAQVNGHRGETPDGESIRRRVEHDLWYIDNWSFGFDLRILLRTVRAIVRGVNAY